MSKGHFPSVFVSSTCYDLSQIRENLKSFLDDNSMDPILSEYNTFPVNPNLKNIPNCLQNIKDKADIFVLIIGSRYGNETDGGKTITNLEYLHAQSYNIPIFVFINKEIQTHYKAWERNPANNFEGIVENKKLFEFIKEVYANQCWIYQFTSAKDIIDTLKKQFAYLFSECLDIKKRYRDSHIPEYLTNVNSTLLQLYIERPDYWEYDFFIEATCLELDKCTDLENDYELGLATEAFIDLSVPSELFDWIDLKFEELIGIVEAIISTLVNNSMYEGKPKDEKHSLYIAQRLALHYRKLLSWMIQLRSVKVQKKFNKILETISMLAIPAIKDIKNYKNKMKEEGSKAISDARMGKDSSLSVVLNFSVPDTTAFEKELEVLRSSI